MSYSKNISALAVSQLVTAVCNFISALLIAKMLLPAGQGQWSLYANAFAFGAVALSFGLPQALTYYIASKKIKMDQVLLHALVFALSTGLVFGIFIFGLTRISASAIFLPDNIPTYWIYCGLGGHFTLLIMHQLFAAIFHANKQFIIAAVIALIGAVFLVFIYSWSFFGEVQQYQDYFGSFIVGNIGVLIIQCILSLFFLIIRLGYSIKIGSLSLTFYKPLIVFASWIYITNLLQFLSYKMDVWFISGYVTDESRLGIYTVAASLAQLLWLVPAAFHSVIFTDIAEKNSFAFRLKIKSWVKKVLLGAALLSVLGYLLSFKLVPLLFGQAYVDISVVLPFLLPGIVLFSASILLSAYFSGINRVDINFRSTVIGFVSCVILNVLLIPQFGIYGAAIASSISYSLSAFYLYFLFSKE